MFIDHHICLVYTFVVCRMTTRVIKETLFAFKDCYNAIDAIVINNASEQTSTKVYSLHHYTNKSSYRLELDKHITCYNVFAQLIEKGQPML